MWDKLARNENAIIVARLLHISQALAFILTTTVRNIGTKDTNPLLLQCLVEEAMELM